MASISSKILISVATLSCLILVVLHQQAEAKLLRRSRYYDDIDGGSYGSPYGGAEVATGQRALITVRGARNTYDGYAPSKINIEDNPYRGPYPRGVYDRLDGMGGGLGGGRYPMYPNSNHGMGSYGYGSMYGAPARIGVTGAFPYGYGGRY